MSVQPLINNLKQLKQHLENTLDAQVNANLTEFADMQRDRLDTGKNNEGDNLTRNEGFYPYSPKYTAYKRAKGGQVNFVDLKLNGDFHAGITATKVGKSRVTLYSKDKKERFLPSQYTGIYGFSPNQKKELNDMFKPRIVEAAKFKITNRR
jgi:hypothetical protein